MHIHIHVFISMYVCIYIFIHMYVCCFFLETLYLQRDDGESRRRYEAQVALRGDDDGIVCGIVGMVHCCVESESVCACVCMRERVCVVK